MSLGLLQVLPLVAEIETNHPQQPTLQLEMSLQLLSCLCVEYLPEFSVQV
jgi:hypothetical protein